MIKPRIAKDGILKIRVYGEPQPVPKTHTAIVKRGGKTLLMPVSTDYRTRTNPITGQVEKYAHGYKKKWQVHVQKTVLAYMARSALDPFPKNHPILLGLLFFLTRPPSNKRPFPSQAPDYDNYAYAIWNCLKRTPAKTKNNVRVEGRFSDGVLFYDDDQIIGSLVPSFKLWATEADPPGVLISVCDLNQMRHAVRDYMQESELPLTV